jgi:hypothetical protein
MASRVQLVSSRTAEGLSPSQPKQLSVNSVNKFGRNSTPMEWKSGGAKVPKIENGTAVFHSRLADVQIHLYYLTHG